MGNVRKLYQLYRLEKPLDGKIWCVEKVISIDGGKTYNPTYVKEYFYTESDANIFIESKL